MWTINTLGCTFHHWFGRQVDERSYLSHSRQHRRELCCLKRLIEAFNQLNNEFDWLVLETMEKSTQDTIVSPSGIRSSSLCFGCQQFYYALRQPMSQQACREFWFASRLRRNGKMMWETNIDCWLWCLRLQSSNVYYWQLQRLSDTIRTGDRWAVGHAIVQKGICLNGTTCCRVENSIIRVLSALFNSSHEQLLNWCFWVKINESAYFWISAARNIC